MNMNQNSHLIYKAEDIDWNDLEATGIHKEKLEKDGNLDLLLQGKETESIPLRLRTSLINLTMDATLRLVSGEDGKLVMEINGIRPEEASETESE